jgi:CRP-like cAMP-binding protein
MSYVEYKKNKSIYKVGDKGDKLFFIIKGKVNIYRPIKVKVKMSFKDYLSYCLLLSKYKEDFLLNQILMTYCKTIPIMFPEELKKTFQILFKMKLLDKIQKEIITNNRQLLSYFKENDVNLDDFDLNFKLLENFFSERRKSTKKGIINLENGNEKKSANQDWINYIFTKCNIPYSESSYFEKFEKLLLKREKMDIECFIFELAGSAETGNYFGEISVEKDGSFIRKKREYSIFAEEDTIIGTIKNEDFIYIIAPKMKIERMKNINFINNNYFFKPINSFNFSRKYFQYFIRHELSRGNHLFKINSTPNSLYIIQEGIISLKMQCTLVQLNEIIQKLYIKLLTNKYYSEVISKKIVSKETVDTIKRYVNDPVLKNLKLHTQNFIEEINKIRNFQISTISNDELIDRIRRNFF